MRPLAQQTMTEYLDALAGRVPAPGGGAVAALAAAQAAGLLAMVARYTNRPADAEHASVVATVLDECDALRARCLQLADDDATAFGAVAEAYALPRRDDEERQRRSAAIQSATAGAAEPPAATVEAAGRLIELAGRLAPVANTNVITDVAAGADMAAAAATIGRLNVEINLASLQDDAVAAGLIKRLTDVPAWLEQAARVSAAIRESIAARASRKS